MPGGGADRRRCRCDEAAGASAARRRRRAVYLRHDRLRHRSEDRLHQCRPAPADAALRTRNRHRPRRAERPAGDLPGQRRRGKAHAGELRARRASDRSCRRRDADAGRRAWHRRDAARRAAAVVKCITNDIRVPADAEYVIEGYLDEKGHREPEGPYGEFLGYYGAVKRNPVFHVTAITHRDDALFQTSTIGGKTLGRTDTAQLSALRTEISIWHALQAAVREPVAVYATTSSGGAFNVRVAHPPARAGRGAQRHRRLHGRARQLQERLCGRSRRRHLLRRADGLGDGDALPARPRPDRDERHAHPAARSVAAAGQPRRRQGRLRPDLAVRARRDRLEMPGAGAADVRRQALSPRSRRRWPTARSSSRS